jgi:hypothetical protein
MGVFKGTPSWRKSEKKPVGAISEETEVVVDTNAADAVTLPPPPPPPTPAVSAQLVDAVSASDSELPTHVGGISVPYSRTASTETAEVSSSSSSSSSSRSSNLRACSITDGSSNVNTPPNDDDAKKMVILNEEKGEQTSCCRLGCPNSVTDKSQGYSLSQHCSASFFNEKFRTRWLKKDCDEKTACLCTNCGNTVTSWLQLEPNLPAADNYTVAFYGIKSNLLSSLIYRSNEFSGESRVAALELIVKSNDGFIANFEVCCYIAGVPVAGLSESLLKHISSGDNDEGGNSEGHGEEGGSAWCTQNPLEVLACRDRILSQQVTVFKS